MTRGRLFVSAFAVTVLALVVWQRTHRAVSAFPEGMELGP